MIISLILIIVLGFILFRIFGRKKQIYQCASCGRNDVKLYRPYGSFFRENSIYCNQHVDENKTSWYVPFIYDEKDGGMIWGYNSVPKADIDKWQKLPDSNPFLPKWIGGLDWWK